MHEHGSKHAKMHREPTVAPTSMVSIKSHEVEKGNGMHEATDIMVMHPKWAHPNKASQASSVTTQPQTH